MAGMGVEEILSRLGNDALAENMQAWGRRSAVPPANPNKISPWRKRLEEQLFRLMQREGLVRRKINLLSTKLTAMFEILLARDGFTAKESKLIAAPPRPFRGTLDMQASLAALERAGLVFSFPVGKKNTEWLIPREVGSLALWLKRRQELGLEHPLTLRSFLERMHFLSHNGQADDAAARRATYRFLAAQSAVMKRLALLSPGLKKVVEMALTNYGGIMQRSTYRRLADLPPWGGESWRAELEERAIGTIKNLSLVRFGVDLDGETLILFLETGLAWFRERRLPTVPTVVESLSGVDLVSNLERIIDLARSGSLKLTSQGLPHRWVEKKIDQSLLPMGGGHVTSRECFRFIVRFCWSRGLVESGKDSWVPTAEGEEILRRPFTEIVLDLLGFAVTDTELLGESYHQVRMRRRLLRFLRRLKAGDWIHPMDLPFLSRNAYLAGLDALAAEEFFESRFRRHIMGSMESARQMASHLQDWVARRLHILGLIDLGFADGEIIGLTLSEKGEQLLSEAPSQTAVGATSTIVVNPDFEVFLFPESDQEEAIHFLDRFTRRTVSDRVIHFQLTEEELMRGLQSGLTMGEILSWLEERARAPLPRNILYTLKEWGDRAGIVQLRDGYLLKARTKEMVEKLLDDPELSPHVLGRPGTQTVIIDGSFPRMRLQEALRGLGFMVEP